MSEANNTQISNESRQLPETGQAPSSTEKIEAGGDNPENFPQTNSQKGRKKTGRHKKVAKSEDGSKSITFPDDSLSQSGNNDSEELHNADETATETIPAGKREHSRRSASMTRKNPGMARRSLSRKKMLAATGNQDAEFLATSSQPEDNLAALPADSDRENVNYDQFAAEYEDADRQKKRRGPRGDKGRNRKLLKDETPLPDTAPVVQRAFKSALETARELQRIPALPPSPDDASQEEKCTRARKKKRQANGSATQAEKPAVRKRMFISVLPGEQIEVALAEDGTLLEYYLDMLHQRKIKGNIYKGVIHNIDTNLQAAFVDYGAGKNGFLQIDQVHPEYWQTPHESSRDKKFPPIQKALKNGQELLVQVVKEPAGNKGAFLTTWLSLAGRFLVLTPGQEQIGVSRKVTDMDERNRLREMMNGIEPGNGLGVIVRTVGEGATKTILKTDLQYLKRLWRDIRKKATEVSAPALIHQEPGLSERSVRDYLTEDINEIWVDDETEAQKVRSMASLLFPRKKDLVHFYADKGLSLWDHFNLTAQVDQIYSREVMLPSGGRLVFDQTEALMAIDINSGKISGKGNFEAMAFKTNMEASQAIARQLRLRDVGGQVVIDFIEMREKKHVMEVEKALRQAMKNDRAKHDVAHMSSFALLELVRQRMGSSALSICMETCAACGGTGLRRNLEWHAVQTLRDLRHKMQRATGLKYIYDAPRELGLYLLNYKRDYLHELEKDLGKTLEIKIQA